MRMRGAWSRSRIRKNEQGYTFIEVILAIVLLAIGLPALLQLFENIVVTSARVDALPTAVHLAEGLMEEIKSRKFDERNAKDAQGNWSSILGPDAGESGNKILFDDIDDFNAWNETLPAPFDDFTVSVQVGYVSNTDLNHPLTIPSPLTNNWTPSYKRVVVTVSGAGFSDDIQLITIMTEAQTL